jgi:hypothetical protein
MKLLHVLRLLLLNAMKWQGDAVGLERYLKLGRYERGGVTERSRYGEGSEKLADAIKT